MTTQMSSRTMNLFAAISNRDAGISQAMQPRSELIHNLRTHLRMLARSRGDRSVTADDCTPYLESIGMSSKDLGNAAGGVFRDGNWAFTGNWVPSKRPSSNARMIRVWRLK
jgi:hypothetical protein